MGILLAYFLWVTSTLAIIVTAWIGVADSGVERVRVQRVAMGRSYGASLMAEDDIAPATTAPAQTAAASDHHTEARMPGTVAASTRARVSAKRRPGRHVAPRLGRSLGAGPSVALRANLPFDGH
jgi:hypothetical protein